MFEEPCSLFKFFLKKKHYILYNPHPCVGSIPKDEWNLQSHPEPAGSTPITIGNISNCAPFLENICEKWMGYEVEEFGYDLVWDKSPPLARELRNNRSSADHSEFVTKAVFWYDWGGCRFGSPTRRKTHSGQSAWSCDQITLDEAPIGSGYEIRKWPSHKEGLQVRGSLGPLRYVGEGRLFALLWFYIGVLSCASSPPFTSIRGISMERCILPIQLFTDRAVHSPLGAL